MPERLEYPVKIDNLSWSYRDKCVLSNIGLTFEKNKFHSIIGPNGSGKTTLLKNISRILEPGKGVVFIGGKDIVSMGSKEAARRIACVPQNTSSDFDFSAMDIVMMGRSPHFRRFQPETEEDLEIVRNAMVATSTWQLKNKNINEISGGERQRVIIARALAQKAGIILLDEPISQLDIHHQVEILDMVKLLVINSEVTVLAVLHDLNMAAEYSDNIVLVDDGRIFLQGTPEQVLTGENIEKVYNLQVRIIKNPVTGKPHLIPVSTVGTGNL